MRAIRRQDYVKFLFIQFFFLLLCSVSLNKSVQVTNRARTRPNNHRDFFFRLLDFLDKNQGNCSTIKANPQIIVSSHLKQSAQDLWCPTSLPPSVHSKRDEITKMKLWTHKKRQATFPLEHFHSFCFWAVRYTCDLNLFTIGLRIFIRDIICNVLIA